MAFSDLPIIDKPSLNADESATALRGVISQRNGFIPREDVPDKGCDFDVELVNDIAQATNWRFATQLKSVERLALVNGDNFISYAFETSRLGYLLRRTPATGILVIYSVEQRKLYYELADVLYNRLLEERGNEDWKQNEKVNIRIPVQNELNETSAANLRNLFLKRFENAELMQRSHGAKYDLPTINVAGDDALDMHSMDSIKRALKKYGIALLSRYDINMVFSMVNKLPMPEINSDKELQIIAAVVFCEAGKHAEAAYYLERIERRKDIEPHEVEMISFAKIKNDFSLARIDLEQFFEKCTRLRATLGGSQNGITLDINLMYYRLLRLKPLENIPDDMWTTIRQTYREIAALTNTDDLIRALLESWNTDNYSYLIGNARTKVYAEVRVRESIQMPLSVNEKRLQVLSMADNELELTKHLEGLQRRSRELDKPLLMANVILIYNRHRLSHELDLISFGIAKVEGIPQHIAMLHEHIGQAIRAYNIFVEESRFKEAYQSLCNTIDLITIAREWYNSTQEYNDDYFFGLRRMLEADLEIEPYDSPIIKLIAQYPQAYVQRPPHPSDYAGMDDAQIDYMATIVCKSLGIPTKRTVNIINEMKAYRLFYQRCQNPVYQLLQYDSIPRTTDNRYERPIQFVIRSSITGLETRPGTDMNDLLQHWRL